MAGRVAASEEGRASSRVDTLDKHPVGVNTLPPGFQKRFWNRGNMPGERTTIRELARLSGVSVGTVSRALNGYTDVRPETRERIVRLARELDYTPAAAARTLVTQRSHVIGVFLETGKGHPDLQHPFFHEVLVGLKDRIGAARLRPAPVRLRAPRQRLRRPLLPQALPAPQRRRRRADGRRRRRRRAAPAAALRAPCVGVDVELAGTCTSYVMSDNSVGADLAVRHLHELGHRRIATITGLLDKKPGDRPPARLPRGAAAARARLPRRVRRVRRLLLRDGPPGRPQAARAGRAADGDLRRLGHDGPRGDPGRRRGRPDASRATCRSSASTTSSSPSTCTRR